MESKFSFIKTILLAIASAITLVAVSFAWFTTADSNSIGSLASYTLSGAVIRVSYYKEDSVGSDTYTAYNGDFDVSFDSDSGSQKYKMDITNVSGGSIDLTAGIDELSSVSTELLNNIYINYSLKSEDTEIQSSNGDITLATVLEDDGSLINLSSLSATSYTLEYTIGLVDQTVSASPIGSEEITSASIGSINISATASATE